MKIAVVGSPKTYESDRLTKEGFKLGHQVEKIPTNDLILSGDQTPKFSFKEKDSLNFDAFIFRGISRHIPQVLIFAQFLIDNSKIVIDESLGSERYITSKFATIYQLSKNKIPIPRTYQTLTQENAIQVSKKLGFPLIAKLQTGSKGKGVFKIGNKNELLKLIKNESQDILLQEFIDSNYDVRVFVVGKKILGGMKRTAPPDDFRSNVAQGGTTEKYDIDDELSKLVLKTLNVLKDDVVGIDVMFKNNNPVILEVNRAPQFQGFEKATKVNVAKEFIKYTVSKK